MSSVKLDHRETKTISDTPRLDRSLAQESKRRKVEAEAVSEDGSSLMSRELSEVELQSKGLLWWMKKPSTYMPKCMYIRANHRFTLSFRSVIRFSSSKKVIVYNLCLSA